MPNFWEPTAKGHWAHGFLICGATQNTGYEFHGTFPRDGKLPHISIYKIGDRSEKVTRNLWLRVVNGTAGLTGKDRDEFVKYSSSESILNNFLVAVYDKHLSLNPPATTSGGSKTPTFSDSDFPALGGSSSPVPPVNVTPPLTANKPVSAPVVTGGGVPQLSMNDPLVASIMRMSGALD